jgi:hypothetical protein
MAQMSSAGNTDIQVIVVGGRKNEYYKYASG